MIEDQVDSIDEAAEAEVSADQEKCTRQLVQIAVKKLKYLSNQLKDAQFIAETATRNTSLTENLASDAKVQTQTLAQAKNKI